MNTMKQNWIDKTLKWEEYPIGTKAQAIGGAYWIRVERGWKWFNGSTFPRPGADASGKIELPIGDMFGNQYPVQIESCEWWFNGRIIQKQNHSKLPWWVSFNDDENNTSTKIHFDKNAAIDYCFNNPCIKPKHLPKDYL